MSISRSVANALWGRSGGRCYLDPSEELTRTPSGSRPVGEIAHIVAQSGDGPRGSSDHDVDRDSADNLILLCPNHHREVDLHPDIWTVERLSNVKAHHEEWVREQLSQYRSWFPDVTRRDQGTRISVGLERAYLDPNQTPYFSFGLRNLGPDTVVVHHLYVEVLAVDVRPSVVAREHRLSTSMLVMRTPVTFSLKNEQAANLPPTTFPEKYEFDNLAEVGIQLAPDENQLFSASLHDSDFCAGVFRIGARFWQEPDHHFATASPNFGVFYIPDTKGWGVAFHESDTDATAVEGTRLAIVGINELIEQADPLSAHGEFDWQVLASVALGRLDVSAAREVVAEWLMDPGRCDASIVAIGSSSDSEWRAMMVERALSLGDARVRLRAVPLIESFRFERATFDALRAKAIADVDEGVRLAAQKIRPET